MDYEKKYKEAVNKIRNLLDDGEKNGFTIVTYKTDLESIFPELKESEDERIRKALKEYFINSFQNNGVAAICGVHIIDILTWLEKQGEPQDKGEISDGYHTFNELYYYRMLYNAAFFNMLPKEWVHKSKRHNDGEECFGGGWFIVMANLPTGQISNHYELKDWDLFQIPEKEVADKWDGHTPQEAADRLYKYLLEKQGEQKPADKVESKFKVGDWVVYYRNDSSREIMQIYDIRDGRYYFTDNVHFSWSVKECDEKSHLWTIQDAKDGDVLACGDKISCPFIFHNLTEKLNPRAYCGVNTLFHFQYNNENCGHWCYSNEVRPATKEECDLLFSKMKEAGYEWNEEKKELKKISQRMISAEAKEAMYAKTAWSEEDEEMLVDAYVMLDWYKGNNWWTARRIKDWLKSLKERIGG